MHPLSLGTIYFLIYVHICASCIKIVILFFPVINMLYLAEVARYSIWRTGKDTYTHRLLALCLRSNKDIRSET